MKASIHRNYFFNLFNTTKPLCERTGKRLPYSWWGRRSLGEFISAQFRKTLTRLVHVGKVHAHGLSALAAASEVNARLYVGLVFAGIVMPLAACVYLLFDKTDIVQGWYHVNNFYLFMLLGPYLSALALVIGVFLLFPYGAKRAYILLAPAGYLVGKIIWLYYTNSNAEFHSLPHWSYFLTGLLISSVVFVSMDFLTWRKFHRVDAFEKRLEGIYQTIDNLPAEKVVSMFKTTWREKREFQKQY